MEHILEIKDLHVSVEDKKILNGVSLILKSGDINVIMGPNGSGKSTLCYTILGHPKYEIESGDIFFDGKSILDMDPHERAHLGLFLGFQHPIEIPGVTFGNFLRMATNAKRKTINEEPIAPMPFIKILKDAMDTVKMDHKFIGRPVNEGFSGGEKKRAEIVQLSVLEPKMAFLDEVDSGLDIDALKVVSEGINTANEKLNTGMLLITHYERILQYVKPNFVHVMAHGKIVTSGGPELAAQLEAEGYENIIN